MSSVKYNPKISNCNIEIQGLNGSHTEEDQPFAASRAEIFHRTSFMVLHVQTGHIMVVLITLPLPSFVL